MTYFSLEDPAEEIVVRLFQNESRIPQSRQFVGKGGLTEGDFSRATTAAANLSRMDFTIIDDVYDLTGIIASTRKLKAQKPSSVSWLRNMRLSLPVGSLLKVLR